MRNGTRRGGAQGEARDKTSPTGAQWAILAFWYVWIACGAAGFAVALVRFVLRFEAEPSAEHYVYAGYGVLVCALFALFGIVGFLFFLRRFYEQNRGADGLAVPSLPRFDERIRLLRAERGLSQADLAALCDVSRQTVYKWERHSMLPGPQTLQRLAECLGVDAKLLSDARVRSLEAGGVQELAPEAPKKRFRRKYSGEQLFVLFLWGLAIFAAGVLLLWLASRLNFDDLTYQQHPDAGELWNYVTTLRSLLLAAFGFFAAIAGFFAFRGLFLRKNRGRRQFEADLLEKE